MGNKFIFVLGDIKKETIYVPMAMAMIRFSSGYVMKKKETI